MEAARRKRRRSSSAAQTAATSVPVATFIHPVEAEVARTTLEGSGIPCRIERSKSGDTSGRQLHVAPADAESAEAILFPDRRRQSLEPSIICPACGARHGVRQGKAFWVLLFSMVGVLFLLALFVSKLALVGLAVLTALTLVLVDVILKDWKCGRCDHRWRTPRRPARSQ